MTKFSHRMTYPGGADIVLPLLPLICLTLSLTGCSSPAPSFEGSGTAAIATAAPAAPLQSETEHTATDFVSALRSKAYPRASALTTSSFQKRVSFSQWNQGPYRLLIDSSDLHFSSAQPLAHGSKAVLRGQFSGSDGKTYHTNFIFLQAGSDWKIDDVVAPVFHQAPQLQSGTVSRSQ